MTGIINIGNSFYSSLHTTRNTLTSSSEPPKKNAGMVVPSQNLTNFLNKLPYDIIHNIFSRLTQQDCLECMAVSMVWMELVPQYTTMLWKKIKISFDDNDYSDHEEELVTQLSPKMIRCLGSHVRHIVISHCSEEQVHLILSILSKRGCSPRTVGKYYILKGIMMRGGGTRGAS
ncbi:hypothetical protein BDC45DRAFT_61386 [Circinella umbellata]|nr:hypothetical protein BDC45DRAFT_61386 [Circinella umbellata]